MTPPDLPGPKSAVELERLRAVLYPGIGEDLAPFVIERKSGSTLVDLDGNEYVDCASASASVALGAAPGGPDRAADRRPAPLRQRGRPRDRVGPRRAARRAPPRHQPRLADPGR